MLSRPLSALPLLLAVTQTVLVQASYSGEMSWYSAGDGGYGSCGLPLYDGETTVYFAALTETFMGSDNPSSTCFQCISVSANGSTNTAIVADTCGICTGADDIKVEQAFYTTLANPDFGEIGVEWDFVDCPAGYTEAALKAVTSADYVAVSA